MRTFEVSEKFFFWTDSSYLCQIGVDQIHIVLALSQSNLFEIRPFGGELIELLHRDILEIDGVHPKTTNNLHEQVESCREEIVSFQTIVQLEDIAISF